MTALARPHAAPRGAQLGAQVVRFLVTGGANTLLTLALYELLLLALPYWLAYAVAYAAGIVFAYVALGRFVFVGRLTVAKLVGHGSSYVVSYVLGLLLLVLFVERVGVASWLAPILIILLLTPVNFIMSRLIFTRDLSFRSLFGRGRPTDGWLRRLPTLLAAFAGILVVLQFAPVASVRLVVDMTSSVAGESRVYVPSGKGGLSEGGSVGVPIAPGHNRLAFRLPSAPAWVRWDPVAGAGTFDIHAMALKVGGVLIPLRLERLAPAAQIAEWKPEGAGYLLKTEPDANDPSVVVPLQWKTAWLVRQGMLTAMAAALLALLALAVVLVRRRSIEPVCMLPALAVTLVVALFASHGLVLLKYSVNVPYWDDWRYFINTETSYPDRLTLWWLFQYANDTIYATGLLFDYLIVRIFDGNYSAHRLVAYWGTLGGILLFAILLIRQLTSEREPVLRAGATVLLVFAVGAGSSYWGAQAIAYHQVLPLLFGLMLVLLLAARLSLAARAVLAVPLSLAAGFAYISGPFFLLGIALNDLWTHLWALRHGVEAKAKCRERLMLSTLVAALALGTLAVHLVIVSQALHGLAKVHTGAPMTLPWTREFWVFFLSQFGKALSFYGHEPRQLAYGALAALAVLGPLAMLHWRLLRGRLQPGAVPVLASAGAVLLGVSFYLVIVSAGRGGFASADNIGLAIHVAKGRFHYWWLTVAVPFSLLAWWRLLQQTPLAARPRLASAAAAALFLVFLLPKDDRLAYWRNWKFGEIYRLHYGMMRAGLDCVRRHAGAPTILCPTIYPVDLAPYVQVALNKNYMFAAALRPTGAAGP